MINMQNNKQLFLDDLRNPIECVDYMKNRCVDSEIYKTYWCVVRSYVQFIKYIEENGLPSIISFDHDLGDSPELRSIIPIEEWYDLEESKEYTGMDCAKWLVNYCLDNSFPLPKYIVHSANPVGKENIESLFLSFLKNNQ